MTLDEAMATGPKAIFRERDLWSAYGPNVYWTVQSGRVETLWAYGVSTRDDAMGGEPGDDWVPVPAARQDLFLLTLPDPEASVPPLRWAAYLALPDDADPDAVERGLVHESRQDLNRQQARHRRSWRGETNLRRTRR